MARKQKWTDEEIAEALRTHSGIVSAAAQYLGYSAEAIRLRMRKNPQLAEVQREQINVINDVAEGHLINHIRDGNMQAITYWLSRQGRERGWGSEPRSGMKDNNPPLVRFFEDRPPQKAKEVDSTQEKGQSGG